MAPAYPGVQASEVEAAPAVPEGRVRRVSLADAGFVAPALIVRPPGSQFKRLMLSLEGDRGTGKSELADSAPGLIAHLVLDRGIDSVIDNPFPPLTRNPNAYYKTITVPKASQAEDFKAYWQTFRLSLMDAIHSTDGRTVVIDGDPDSWELQRLAEFGRLTKVPPILYDTVNSARRALYARCYDSGKIIISTSRVRQVWETVKNPITGLPEVNSSGNDIRRWTGEYEKQGFNDGGYIWTIQARTLYNEDTGVYGFRFMTCKVNRSVEGQEFWGDECNMETLLAAAYPNVPREDWGF